MMNANEGMMSFLTGRLLQSLAVVLFMSFAVYMLIGLMPGDPIDLMVAGNPHATADDVARLKAAYGLDKPLIQRYLTWLGAAAGGDFGYSRLYHEPVLDVLSSRIVSTLTLLGLALTGAVLLALPIGVYAARKPGKTFDTVTSFCCFAGISTPPFWLALLLIILFSIKLHWLPAGGADAGVLSLILPVMTLVLVTLGGYIRYIRSGMIEALRADFIRTARAKGCSDGRVLWGHALKVALIPFVTVVAMDLGLLFEGVLITETMFARPGMGKLIFDAIMGNDYNLALVGLLFATGMILIGNLLADLLYVALDPRLSFRGMQA